MKYAGMLNPPPKMTKEVYDFVLSHYSKEIVKGLESYRESMKRFRSKTRGEYRPITDRIDSLRAALETEGTRNVYKAYKEFFEWSNARFPYEAVDYRMKAFSGIKDKNKRAQVKGLVEKNIEKVLNRIEDRLSYGEKVIPEINEAIKNYQNLILKGPKGKEDKKHETGVQKRFPIVIDGWYYDQLDLEDTIENKTVNLELSINKYIEDSEEELVHIYDMGYNPVRTENRIKRLEERIEHYEKMLEELEQGKHTIGYDHITVFINIQHKNKKPSSYNGALKIMKFNLEQYIDEIPKIRVVKDGVHRVVVHEMTHMAQSVLSYLTEKNQIIDGVIENRGVPSNKIRTPQFDQHTETPGMSKLEQHFLDDAEFYTDLRDATRRILYQINHSVKTRLEDIDNGWNASPYSEKDKLELFKCKIGQPNKAREYCSIDPFFQALKRHALPKYQKAVGEAYKLVFNTQIRMGEKKKTPEPTMPKYRDPNAMGMFDGTGVGSSGKGKHKNRKQDVSKGRSRKRKHKKDLRREIMAAKVVRKYLSNL
jgi:uncharacterized coiled-coil protein SlyX